MENDRFNISFLQRRTQKFHDIRLFRDHLMYGIYLRLFHPLTLGINNRFHVSRSSGMGSLSLNGTTNSFDCYNQKKL